ncbi:amino acid adenylation domain-containing protein [Chitinophaga varians]|uniref:amino acid adenylation domain-containing protein n=1 Tax=Chitinophaga varians TaxID=2202339 RepID=UPI00165F3A8A|nr:non-ribosomal peptide synthetase [Chitinophaga varians]MBC9914519.1 amino acid adenylation domain-containing protein [Chitinophaga varians]
MLTHVFPLHPTQKDIYVDQLMHPESPHYTLSGYLKLKGPLNKARFAQAVSTVISGNDIFRMSFDLGSPQPEGYLSSTSPEIPLQAIDHSHLDNAEAYTLEWMQQQCNTTFPLKKDHPLFEHYLIKITEEEHWYQFRYHHLIIDGSGYQLFLQAIARQYRQPDSTHAYPSYAKEIEAYSPFYQSGAYRQQLHYWEDKLKNKPPKIFNYTYPHHHDYGKTSSLFTLPLTPSERTSLEQLAQTCGYSLQKITVAAVVLYFAHITGHTALLLGVVRHRRLTPQQRCTMGMYSGIVPFIGQYSPDETVLDLLHKIDAAQKEDYPHQQASLNDLSRMLKDKQTDSALFEVLVNYVLLDLQLDFDESISTSFHQIWTEYERRPLRIYWQDYGRHQPLQLNILHQLTHIQKAEAVLLSRRILHIISQFADNLPRPVSEIDIIPADEKLLLLPSSRPLADCHSNKTIWSIFEQQAARTPDHIAITCNDHSLTYNALFTRARQLGYYLSSKGVGKDVLVPVCIERSTEMIVALLGILSAGGAYVPIDPEYPEERIRFMLEDTAAPIVITSVESQPALQTIYHGETVILSDQSDFSAAGITAPPAAIQPHDAAYVIYTSGSTGKPKGVIIEHRNVVSLFDAMPGYYDFHEKDVWTMFHSYCFDFSVWEMYGALFYGGRLVIVPKHLTRDTTAFAALLKREQVTVLNQTPAAFYVLQEAVATNDAYNDLSVRYVTFGGEALNPARLQSWNRKFPDCSLINMYGITETTVHVTYQPITREHLHSTGSIIGRPIPSLGAYILDARQQLQPIGVPGELYISGAGLARGYLNRDELTAERFIANPFDADTSPRLYRTGDLARWLPDGTMEYLGRIDNQVKIRGFRIELGEIENVLHRSDAVKQAAVFVKSNRINTSEEKQLAACIVPNGEFNREAIIRHLRAWLPDYMVPLLLTPVSEIPLTKNGKVDKAALSALDTVIRHHTERTGPQNARERQLAHIWEQVLGVNNISRNDNFFELGGDSIRLIKVVSSIKKAFDRELQAADVYKAATIADLSQLIGEMPANTHDASRTAIMAEITRQKNSLLSALPDVDNIEDIFPMSDIQAGMIYASLRAPEDAIYHDQFSSRMPLNTDLRRLEKVLSQVSARHGILRTAFSLDAHTENMQIVYKSVPIQLPVLDWSHLENDNELIAEYLKKERTIPFHYAQAPLWRTTVIKLKTHCVFVLQMHHAILDGWSVASLNTEINNRYTSSSTEALPALKATYKDYVIENILEKNNAQAKAFWTQEMNGYKHLDIFTTEKVSHRFLKKYESGILDAVKLQAQKEGVAVSTLFLGAFYYALSMLTHEEELTLGLVTSNRPLLEDAEQMLGCFLNTIPLRCYASGRATWRDLMRGLEQQQLTIRAYDRLPLAEIAKLHPNHNTDGNPFFDVLFNFINFHVYDQLHERLLQGTVNDPGTMTFGSFAVANTYLDCTVSITGDVLTILLCQSYQLKSGKTLEDFSAYLDQILQQMLHHYDDPIDRTAILSPYELDRCFTPMNNITAEQPLFNTIPDTFEKQVSLQPDAPALIGNSRMTYAELNARANQLAYYLKAQGVTKDTPVPVCINRSADLIIAILGILKAGGAYLPLDPAYPKERIARMLEDITYQAAITMSSDTHLSDTSAKVICLDTLRDTLSTLPADDLQQDIHPEDLAYVMFTSGSTGRPKGVMVTHGNVVSLTYQCDFARLTANDVLLTTSALSFDGTTLDFWGMLLNGGQLVLCSDEQLLDNELLKKAIRQHQVTKIWFTSGWLNQLIDTDISIFQSLHMVIAGGEKLSATHIRKLRQAYPDLDIINGYGPTENTTGSLNYRIGPEVSDDIPIGRPMKYRTAYVLDKQQRLLPVGVTGELYVGGAGLARGYYNNPGLTAERFIAHPFVAGERLYQTGDLACFGEDGQVAFRGRADDQVKVRGYRIEPGEIEHMILKSALVERAVIIVKKDTTGNGQLIAYVVPLGTFDKKALLQFLTAHLPEYMVPAAIHPMSALPLTPNGKVDKQALPDFGVTAEIEHVAPDTATEKAIAAIWQQLLNTNAVGKYDNFFQLGGHSLLVIRLRAHIKMALHVSIPVGKLFHYRTLDRLSAYIDELQQSTDDNVITPFDRSHPMEVPLSFGQEELWLIDREIGTAHYHMPFIFHLRGDVNKEALTQAFRTLVDRHEPLRTVIRTRPADAKGGQYFLTANNWKLAFTDLSFQQDEAAIQSYLQSWLASPFDLSKDYMLKAHLITTGADEHLLMMLLHHIAADGWSLAILMKEFTQLYHAYCHHEKIPLPPLPLQFADYALWQRRQIASGILTPKLRYWTTKLEGYTPWLLPSDYERPLQESNRGRMLHFHADHTLTAALHALAQRHDSTLFMTLLAAFNITLHQFSGKDDICVATAVAGRTTREMEDLIGFFSNNLLPLRSSLAGNPSFTALLQQVRQTAIEAYEAQEVPLEMIMEALADEWGIQDRYLYQAIFILQNTPELPPLQLDNVTMKEVKKTHETSQYELNVSVREKPDGLLFSVEFNTDIFRQETITKLFRKYLILLNNIIASPEQKIQLLLPADEWNTVGQHEPL